MVKAPGPRRSSQGWRTFLQNQVSAIWTCDFCVQYTVRFTALYIFVIMELGTRKVMQVNVTEQLLLRPVVGPGHGYPRNPDAV